MVAGLSHSKHKLSGTMDDDEKEGLEVVDWTTREVEVAESVAAKEVDAGVIDCPGKTEATVLVEEEAAMPSEAEVEEVEEVGEVEEEVGAWTQELEESLAGAEEVVIEADEVVEEPVTQEEEAAELGFSMDCRRA